MLEYQSRFAEHFDQLRSSRSKPIYFIEHGLPVSEIADLHLATRRTLGKRPLEEYFWDAHPLPLLVSAVEIGYRYCGPGKDFWPLLEKELDTTLRDAHRQRIRDLFRLATDRHGGVRPPESPWARAFHLISWPIAHALLPLEFHRPLASILTRIHGKVGEMDDRALYGAIRRSNRGDCTARFETWLADTDLVTAMVRHLLEGEGADFDPVTMERIANDLQRDDVVRRNIAVARRAQSVFRTPSQTHKHTNDVPAIRGHLRLRRRDKQLGLEAVFPALAAPIAEPLRRELRRQRYAPRLWNVTNRVPSEQFLSGVPFSLSLASVPEEGASLLPGLSELVLPDAAKRSLEAFQLEMPSTTMFAVGADPDYAREVRGSDLSSNRRYWLLTPSPMGDGQLSVVGTVGPLTCYELRPTHPASAAVLEEFGYRIKYGISVSIAGSPPLNPDADAPEFLTEDRLYLIPGRIPASGASARWGSEEMVLADEPVRLVAEPGEHTVAVSTPTTTKEHTFTILPISEVERQQICWVEIRSPAPTADALLAGEVSITVDAIAPIEGLEVTVELLVSGKRLSASMPLGPLPHTIRGDSELWTTIMDDQCRHLILQNPATELHVHVGTLAASTFSLERRLTPYWWDRSGSLPSLRSELGTVSVGGISFSHPLEGPTAVLQESASEAVLLAPLEVDAQQFHPGAAFTTLCLAPKSIKLASPGPDKPPLVRSRRSVGPTGVGLEHLFEAYLRWALAESDSGTAELRRRQVSQVLDSWITELCCGEQWVMRERDLCAMSSDPWELLLEVARAYFSTRFDHSDSNTLALRTVTEIQQTVPDLWQRLDTYTGHLGVDYGALDAAYESALAMWNSAPERTEKNGFSGESLNWAALLGAVRSRREFDDLSELVLPTNSLEMLNNLDYGSLSMSELTDVLYEWSLASRIALAGGTLEREASELILMLWLSPGQAIARDWRAVLDLLVADRCVSRAARYITIRTRHHNQGGGEWRQ